MRHISRIVASLASLALALALLTVGAATSANAAERPDSLGKDFWLTFTKNYAQTPTLSLFISAPRATSGTVSVPGLGFSQNFAVTPGTVETVVVPPGAQLSRGNSGTPENVGIHVTAADEVSVYGLNRIQFTTDAYLGLPVNVLTNRYVVLGFPAQFSPSQFGFVATEDGTEVTYVPTANTTSGVTAGTPKTTTLNQGEALAVSATSGDLSGSVITSTKPIAVFGGQECADVPDTGTQYCDYLVEQIPGTSTWGKSYLTQPLALRTKGDTFRIVAAEDNTSIALNGAPPVTLNAGQVHQQNIEGQASITADKPILMAQYSNGTTFDGVVSDPFMMLTIPTEQFMSEYTFSTPAAGFPKNFVNVVTPTSAVGNVTLDGAPVAAGAFTPIGATGFSGASLELSTGSHTMASDRPFGVYVYGYATDDSYGYPGGAAYAPINDVRSIALTPPNQDATVNTQACVAATVTDQDGKPLAGINVELSATGVNPMTTTGITQAAGTFPYCYTSTTAGTDTFVATFGALSATATIAWRPVAANPTPGPTTAPTPTPTTKPAKAKQRLPIITKGDKSPAVSAGTDGKVVLLRGVRTNRFGNVVVRTRCRPLGASAAGEVRFCRASVTASGKVTVTTTGYSAVRVIVQVRAVPKAAHRDDWRANTWRQTFRVRR